MAERLLSQAYLEWETATLERGEQIGAERAKLKAVPALIEEGFSVEKMAQILGLTVECAPSSLSSPLCGLCFCGCFEGQNGIKARALVTV